MEGRKRRGNIDFTPVPGPRSATYGRAVPLIASAVVGGSAVARQRPPAPLHLFLVVMHVVEYLHRAIVGFHASVTGRQ